VHYDSPKRTINKERKNGAELQEIYPNLVEEITNLKAE
jgi:hypothetical protein